MTALTTGLIADRWGLRPGPFLLGLAYVGLGLGLSAVLVRETRDFETLIGELEGDDTK